MNAVGDKKQKPAKLLSDVPVKSTVTVASEADVLQRQAEDAQGEQQAMLETTPLESQYGAALAAQVEAKHDQVERIEDRLEGMIEQQEAKLHQIEAKQPGFLSLPSTKASWQSQVQQQQALLQRLHGRLEGVREIKDGMGLHGPRVEELASRKLRHAEPELAEGWDEMRAAQRAHEALMRKKEQEKRLKVEREQAPTVGRGQTQSLNLNRSHS
ncbi:IncP plasmid survival protein KfrC family protein [Pseudomonas sp. S2.OTC.A_B10]|uniref:IncP plasmid survival protein KfrC family protein n=1 Tax=Pseudomonas sp. S2.OTC.A_B10 TaxID=3237018 RepID=UPI003CEB1ED7